MAQIVQTLTNSCIPSNNDKSDFSCFCFGSDSKNLNQQLDSKYTLHGIDSEDPNQQIGY